MRVPIIHAVAKLASEVGYIVTQIQTLIGVDTTIARLWVGVLNRIYLVRFGTSLDIVRRVCALVWILLGNKAQGVVGKRCREASLVQGWLPEPYARVVAVTAYEMTNILIYILLELRIFVPELPARNIVDNEESKLVASIHKCRVLRTVSVADYSHTEVAQLLRIAPMGRVRYGITHYGEVLVAISADKRLVVVLAVEEESRLALELD